MRVRRLARLRAIGVRPVAELRRRLEHPTAAFVAHLRALPHDKRHQRPRDPRRTSDVVHRRMGGVDIAGHLLKTPLERSNRTHGCKRSGRVKRGGEGESSHPVAWSAPRFFTSRLERSNDHGGNHGHAGRRADLLGRLRGARLGQDARAGSRIRRDGIARPDGDRARADRLPAVRAGGIRERLDRHGLRLVGGFVPLVLHTEDLRPARESAERIARVLAGAGAGVFVAAAVADDAWSPPAALDDAAWIRLARHLAEIERRVADHGLTLALHPHVGTQIERREDVERMLAISDAGWCLDSGHLLIGGTDPTTSAAPRRPHRARAPQGRRRGHRRTTARRRADARRGHAGGAVPAAWPGDARIDEIVDLLAERATSAGSCSSRTPRSPGGAAGGTWSGHRCADEHRLPALAGSNAEREGC